MTGVDRSVTVLIATRKTEGRRVCRLQHHWSWKLECTQGSQREECLITTLEVSWALDFFK